MSHMTWNMRTPQNTLFASLKMIAFLSIFALLTTGIANAQLMRGHLGGEDGEGSEPEASSEPSDIGEGPSIPEDVSVPLSVEVPPPLAPPWDNELPLVEEVAPGSSDPLVASPEEETPGMTIPPPMTVGEMPTFPLNDSSVPPTASAPPAPEMTTFPASEGGYGGTLPLTNPAETSGLPTMGTVPPSSSPTVVEDPALPPGGIAVDPTDDVITRLKKERVNEALRLYQMLDAEVRQGTAGLDVLVQAHRTLMTAQLALSVESQERIGIRQAYLDACNLYEQEVKAKHEAGLASFTAVQLATMERSNAELDLEQEIEGATATLPDNPYTVQPTETMPYVIADPALPAPEPEVIAPGIISSTESPTYYGPGGQASRPAPDAVGSTPAPTNPGVPCPCETHVYGSPYRSGVIYYSPSRTRIRSWEQRVIGW